MTQQKHPASIAVQFSSKDVPCCQFFPFHSLSSFLCSQQQAVHAPGLLFQSPYSSSQPPGTLLDRHFGPEFVGPGHRFSVVFLLTPDYHSCFTLLLTAPNASFLSEPTSRYAGISPHFSSSPQGCMSSPVCSHLPLPIFCPTKLCLDLYGLSDDQGLP